MANESKYVQKYVPLPAVSVATAGTAVPLTVDTTIYTVAVSIQAELGNTGIIYVGDSTVDSSNGVELNPGDAFTEEASELTVFPYLIRPSDIYIDAASSGDGVRISYIKKEVL